MQHKGLSLITSGVLLALAACAPTPTPPPTSASSISADTLKLFAPLPVVAAPNAYTLSAELVTLGRMLFYDPRLSISQEISCNSCHGLDTYGVDGLQFSLGHMGEPVGRNSPTVYNAALHFAQFWDGRAADVEAQAKGPVLAAGEMGMPDADYVVTVLKTIPGYQPLFEAAFPDDPDPITYDHVAQAIGAFERRLLTPSRFDQFLQGDNTALTAQEQRGLATFVATGCTACHNGVALGGNTYQKMGVVETYPNLTDAGRYEVTQAEKDKYFFKVPSLRNIAQTAPYLHNGSVATLEEMVVLMAKYQLGREVTPDQLTDIVAFLNALTGDLPTDYIAMPTLPENGPDTPGPYETSGQ